MRRLRVNDLPHRTSQRRPPAIRETKPVSVAGRSYQGRHLLTASIAVALVQSAEKGAAINDLVGQVDGAPTIQQLTGAIPELAPDGEKGGVDAAQHRSRRGRFELPL